MILDWPVRAGLCRLWALRAEAAEADYRFQVLVTFLGHGKKLPSLPAILQE